jgi:hypothetical protein
MPRRSLFLPQCNRADQREMIRRKNRTIVKKRKRKKMRRISYAEERRSGLGP